MEPAEDSQENGVTPVTYVESDEDDDELLALSQLQSAALFNASSTPAPPPARKRCPPGKRRSQGYIPRPPNAFMLSRADFVRQKHVPESIQTNHDSLSKIIGNCPTVPTLDLTRTLNVEWQVDCQPPYWDIYSWKSRCGRG